MYYIGIDLGGTNIKAGLVDAAGKIIYSTKTPTLAHRPGAEICRSMCQLATEILEKGGIDRKEIHSIGVGVPGACREGDGTILYTASLNFENFPLRQEMEAVLGLPVFLENDANCAALGEAFALSPKPKNMILVTLGTGIGGGILINGALYSGANGVAGEVGHILLERGGQKCSCGRRGCWEAYASVSALIRQTRAAAEAKPEGSLAKHIRTNGGRVSGKTAFSLAKTGDKEAAEIVNTWISYVADGVVDLANIFQPEILLIGGAISQEGDALMNPLRAIVEENIYKSGTPLPKLGVATLCNDAGLVGAAFLGKKEA